MNIKYETRTDAKHVNKRVKVQYIQLTQKKMFQFIILNAAIFLSIKYIAVRIYRKVRDK